MVSATLSLQGGDVMERTPLRAACESVSTGDAGMFLMPGVRSVSGCPEAVGSADLSSI